MTVFSNVAVVGMHFRGAEVKSLVASLQPPYDLRLEREPENEYDENAVKVFFEDTFIGYIERGVASFLSAWMDSDHTATCVAQHTELRGKNTHPICEITIAES